MFSKGLLGYLPANILQGIVGFATLMVFTRIMSATDYGSYVLAFGVSSIAYTLVFTWMESAMARFYPAERQADPEAPLLYGTIYRLFVLIALLTLSSGFGALASFGGWLSIAGSVLVGLVWTAFDLFVGVLQAFIFMMLTIVYLSQASEHH